MGEKPLANETADRIVKQALTILILNSIYNK